MGHSVISPAIFYWGTPVVLVTTVNEDGTPNIAPISSAWWLGNRAVLGLGRSSQTTANLIRTRQCVLNLPSDDMVQCVNALAQTTGAKDVPPSKVRRGYRYEKDKFGIAGLTPASSDLVLPPRIQECPIHMEAEVVDIHELFKDGSVELRGCLMAIEVKVVRTYVIDELRLPGHANRIDPDKWKPMIMSFQNLYGLKDGKLADSTLAKIDEESYRV
ncbi:hypothetical protein CNMCM7691_006747 [Aspergillus felis]|uniref:Flavin reductase like domain-containing protein n=1 Tax=Aspergillus felis TaxID=1287682 RepID=A0A8H6QRZ3_9EURO|nr:hypothetical protein CNMCM7691_006747 [Aspergillus felis]